MSDQYPLDFLPFTDNQKITAAMLNELVDAIRDGSIFSDEAAISSLVSSFGYRLDADEARIAQLETLHARITMREQKVLAASQSIITLDKTPSTDSEAVFLRGVSLTKDDVPSGFVGQYSMPPLTSVITLSPTVAATVLAGDVLQVVYIEEVL